MSVSHEITFNHRFFARILQFLRYIFTDIIHILYYSSKIHCSDTDYKHLKTALERW